MPIAIAVVEHAGRFLVGRRPPGVPLAGLWEFPGGKIEPGESPEQAACRECLEETGLAVTVASRYPDSVHRYDHGSVRLHFLACEPVDPHCPPAAPYAWVERARLAELDFPAGNRRLLEHLLSAATDRSQPQEHAALRRGVVAVVVRQSRLLVVRRSQHVEAPGAYCFPGGGIEPGESEFDALRREISEELGVSVQPVRRLWHSRTSWHVDLAWWLAELAETASLIPNPSEIESIHWLPIDEMLALDGLLESNRDFLAALHRNEFRL